MYDKNLITDRTYKMSNIKKVLHSHFCTSHMNCYPYYKNFLQYNLMSEMQMQNNYFEILMLMKKSLLAVTNAERTTDKFFEC